MVFNFFYFNFFNRSYSLRISSSRIGTCEKSRRCNVVRLLAREISEYVNMCCSLDLRAIANKSYPTTYVLFGLSLSPIDANTGPYTMQKFAKTAVASNFSSTFDITSRHDVPNKSITVCLFARQLNISELITKIQLKKFLELTRSNSRYLRSLDVILIKLIISNEHADI